MLLKRRYTWNSTDPSSEIFDPENSSLSVRSLGHWVPNTYGRGICSILGGHEMSRTEMTNSYWKLEDDHFPRQGMGNHLNSWPSHNKQKETCYIERCMNLCFLIERWKILRCRHWRVSLMRLSHSTVAICGLHQTQVAHHDSISECPHRSLLGTSLPFTRVTPSMDQVLVALRHRIDSPTMGFTSGLDLTKRLSRNRNRCPPRSELTREILRLFFWLHEKMGKWLMGKYGKIGIRSATISINGKIPIVLGQIYMTLREIHWNPSCVAGQFLLLNRSCLSNSLLIGCPNKSSAVLGFIWFNPKFVASNPPCVGQNPQFSWFNPIEPHQIPIFAG